MEGPHPVGRGRRQHIQAPPPEDQGGLPGNPGTFLGRVQEGGEGHPEGNPGDVPGRETVLHCMAEGEHQGAQEAYRGAEGIPGTPGTDHGRRHRGKGFFRGGVLEDAPGTSKGDYRGRRVEAPVRIRYHRVGQAVPGGVTGEAAGFPVHAVLQGTGGRRVERSQGLASWNRAPEAG